MRIGAAGERPIKFSCENLPEGLSLRENVIEGRVSKSGKYKIKLTAKNALGKDEKCVTLEIGQGKLLLTPLMGFTSWNAFAFEGLTQEKMEYTAKRMEDLGLLEYGYNYVNIDSGWQGEYGGKYDAVIAIGCVIRGDTPHFDYICEGATAGLAKLNVEYDTPVIFGLITTNNLLQAQERSGGRLGNKGDECAVTALQMMAQFK